MSNYAAVDMTLANCVVWRNHARLPPRGYEAQIRSTSSTETIDYCCIQDLDPDIEGQGNIDADPLFVDPDGGDYHLSPGSSCIDAADNAAVPKGMTADLDGNPRFVDDPRTEDTGSGDPPIVDMGVYEFQPSPPCPWDLNADAVVGIGDLLALFGLWGGPGPEGDFNQDGIVGVADMLIMFANWGPCP